jgi:hypothetical protein
MSSPPEVQLTETEALRLLLLHERMATARALHAKAIAESRHAAAAAAAARDAAVADLRARYPAIPADANFSIDDETYRLTVLL